ncbi:GAF domain-containing sensor histidine kinase [Halorarum halobium]|uniref:sensor histidine kinase n=1 Tax=Halorarum halobium TaxID=3075121 RepID=UPI0028AD62B2|nr:GAF domain-containing sensor histidine kinase [Halobaculum sp. XH14]
MNPRDPQGGTERVRALYAATRDLLTAADRESLCAVAVETAEDILGLPFVGVYLLESSGHLEPIATSEAIRERYDEVPVYRRGDAVWSVFEGSEPVTFDRVRDSVIEAGVVVPIGSHGVLVAGAADQRDADETNVELVHLLAENMGVALDRLDRERRLDRLHKAARELMTARDTAAVAASATNAAHEILGLRVNSIHLLSSDGTRLVPVSVTEEARAMFGDIPDLEDGSVGWEAFESGEAVLHGDVRESERVQNPDTKVRSEVVLPLGEHGVFMAGSDETNAFDESDLGLARVFADNVEAALDRAEREVMLRHRERELARQNDRLEEFASVVSHDLRNPLNVAQGRLELAADEGDSEHHARIAEAHGRMEALIEDLLSLARTGRDLGDIEPVALAPLAREVWGTVPGGDLSVSPELGSVSADPSRLRELFENLFRNATEHAGEDVAVTVDTLPAAEGFFVADDGVGIPPGDREEVFERGFTTAEDGTGFGLSIVREIAHAHGWDVALVESDGGGARFEVRTNAE